MSNPNNQNDPEQQQPLQINTNDDMSRGRYSNLMIVSHSPEEFILDWLLTSPNGAHLISRIVLSPGNVKRTIDALATNLKQYEENFGPVKVIEASTKKVH
jgi:hypothetical protein